jgi:tRNA-dihydrouridine synthase
MIGRAAIGYPLDFQRNQTFFETGHLAKPTVIDRVEEVRNHLRGQWNGKGNALELWKRVRIIPIILKESILSNHISNS